MVGDSYFVVVRAAKALQDISLGFIDVIKTATKQFTMAYLSGLELIDRGERKRLIIKINNIPSMMALIWMDRDRRCVITTSSSLEEETPYERER